MRWLSAWVCALVVLAATDARADVVRIGPSADNTMFSEDGSLSNGAGDHFFAGRTDDGFVRRGLLSFDVAGAIPPGSTVTAVTLTLNLSRTRTRLQTLSLHRALAAWGEGTSHAAGEEGAGASATTGDATWTHRLWSTTAWSVPGGTYAGTASASAPVDREGLYSWSSARMVTDVQGWLDDGATSFGWILLGNETGTKVVKRFDSRTHPDLARRPYLEITFTPPVATVSGACCAPDGGCTVTVDPGTSCGGTYMGASTVCTPNPCPLPTGACCMADAAGTCAVATEAGCASAGGSFSGAFTGCAPNTCPIVLTPYVDPLPIPATATPTTGTAGDAATYTMTMRQTTQRLHRDLPLTTVWGFDDGTGTTFPGPTISAASGTPITVTWQNDLRSADGSLRTDHYLPVEGCLHGASDTAKTVVHLHGGHVPAAVDGYPEATFLPGASAVYAYPNAQPAATLWYHDHALGITRLNVYMGLAGLYVIHDPIDAALGLPSGAYDVPLVIQDRAFNRDGTLYYPPTWQEHFFGDVVLVNGKVWPYLEVRRGKYRFRVLNGSNGRTYALRLSTGATFQVIGNDGGLLPAPATVSNLVLAPGERAEIVIDFAGLPAGTEVELLNDAPAPYPGLATENVIPRVMKFVVQSTAGHTAAIPATLRPMTRLVEASAIATRDFELAKSPDACGGSTWMINGEGWSTITERPVLGTTEVWRFMNRSGVMHPMHMHLVFFQVLDRQPFEVVGGVVTPIGARSLPAPGEAGWKDTVQVGPNEIVRVIARFDDYVGRYPYHCHVLEHEDHQMMRQFETTTVCGDGIVSAPIEDCDDGNTTMGDGCEPDCTYSCGADADCSDGNACNGAESCVLATHVCASGVPLGCDDADACTVDACDPASGCTHATVTCDDGNPCTVDGCAPASGCTVTPVADGTPCAEGACIAGACTPLPDAGPGDAGTFDGGASDAGPALDGGGDDAGPRADAGPGADAGPMPADAAADAAPDAASDAGPLPGDTSGCGCRVPSSTPRAPLALLCTAIVIVLLRVARRRRS